MEQPTYGWLIPVTSAEDYVLGAADNILVMLSKRAKPDDIVYEKNQAREHRYRNTCTITSAILAICDLFNEPMTDKELDNVCEEAIKLGLDMDKGWTFYQAVDCARRYWNRTRPDRKVLSFRTDHESNEYRTALSLGYSLVCWFKGNAEFIADKEQDGILQGTEFPNHTFGHCIRKIQNDGIRVVDNYFGACQHNKYLLQNPTALQDNGVFYPSHYLFVRKAELSQSQQDRIEAKQKKLWNGERENDDATRLEVATMCVRAMSPFQNPTNQGEAVLAVNAGIWSGDRGTDGCTRFEAQTMINRALKAGIVVMYPEAVITRGEVAELLVRAMRQNEKK